jgi:hypothetical protein
MPNHVTSRVWVRGDADELQKFVRKYIATKEDGELHLDFNKVIPMPEPLKGVQSGGDAEVAYEAWYGNWKQLLGYPWIKKAGVTTRKALQKFLSKSKEKADLLKRNIEKYGYPTWYEWAIANWGTKWNSYSFKFIREVGPRDWGRTEIEFLFDTAWGPPEPVFVKLAEDNPKLSFTIVSFEEQWGFAGRGEFEEGAGSYDLVDATKGMYKEVYGDEPPEEEIEET